MLPITLIVIAYKTERSRELNKQIRAETKANRATWTAYGIINTPEQPSSLVAKIADDVVVETFGGSHYRRSAA